jgi:hypothetical protein
MLTISVPKFSEHAGAQERQNQLAISPLVAGNLGNTGAPGRTMTRQKEQSAYVRRGIIGPSHINGRSRTRWNMPGVLQTRVRSTGCRCSILLMASISVVGHVRVIRDFIHRLDSPINCRIEDVCCGCSCPLNPSMRGTAGWSALANNKPQSSRAVPRHLLVKGNGFSFAISDRFTSHLRRRFPLHGKSVRDIA